MPVVLTESACKILIRLASDPSLVLVRPPRQAFYSIMPIDVARDAMKTGNTDNRVGQKFQAKVVDRLSYAGFLKPTVSMSPETNFIEITERGRYAAVDIGNETRHPTGTESLARRSTHARA